MPRTVRDKRANTGCLFDRLEPRVLLSGDDHPDWAEFPEASEIEFRPPGPEEPEPGDPTYYISETFGSIETGGDTDVFSFVAPGLITEGDLIITQPEQWDWDVMWEPDGVTGLAPAFEIRDQYGHTFVPYQDGFTGMVLATNDSGSSTFTQEEFPFVAGETYYIIVSAGPSDDYYEPQGVGEYVMWFSFIVPDGQGRPGGNPPAPPGQGDDDYSGGVSFGRAARVVLDDLTGEGSISGQIEQGADTDLFTFTTEREAPLTVRLRSRDGGLGAGLRLFDARTNEVVYSAMAPGAAQTEFVLPSVAAGTYYARVEALDGSDGRYTLQLRSEPAAYRLFEPEGYADSSIRETVAIANPGDSAADFTLLARYETGERDQVLASGTLAPGEQRLVLISEPGQSPLVRAAAPFALEVQSTRPLVASLDHGDFGVGNRADFTARASGDWSFTLGTGVLSGTADFLVLANTSDADAQVEVTLYREAGGPVTVMRTVGAHRRGGINLAHDRETAGMRFMGATIRSSELIVAAMSSYREGRGGFTVLGSESAAAGLLPAVVATENGRPAVSILNTSGATAEVEMTASRADGSVVEIPVGLVSPGVIRQVNLSGWGFEAGEVLAVRYTSSRPIAVAALPGTGADLDALPGGAGAWTSGVFLDPGGFGGGATLVIQNAGHTFTMVTITFSFAGREAIVLHVGLGAHASRRLSALTEPALAALEGGWMLRVDSEQPISAAAFGESPEGGVWFATGQGFGFMTPVLDL